MATNETRQQDEMESLRSIYGDIFSDITPTKTVWNKKASPHFQIFLESHENPDRPSVGLTLDIQFTPTYPTLPPLVKVLHPKNLLRDRLKAIDARIKAIAREYAGEELCFTMITDIKEMLDDFQLTTEAVLSLEEERARRLQNEQALLESSEREAELRERLFHRKMNLKADEEMVQWRRQFPDGAPTLHPLPSSLVPPPDSGPLFVFDNVLYGYAPRSNTPFAFRAVRGFVRHNGNGVLLGIGEHYIVVPYVPGSRTGSTAGGDSSGVGFSGAGSAAGGASRERLSTGSDSTVGGGSSDGDTREGRSTGGGSGGLGSTKASAQTDSTFGEGSGGVSGEGSPSLSLHHITLHDPYWLTPPARDRIRHLETTLENVMAVPSDGILRVYGFQIDQHPQDLTRWSIRILTELPTNCQNLRDLLNTTGHVSWGLARSWLIQLLPALELLHNCFLLHRLLCPSTVALCDAKPTNDDLAPSRMVKLCHPAYAYAIHELYSVRLGRQPVDFLQQFIPRAWQDPDKSADQFSGDVWDLGVLFLRLMLGKDVVFSKFPTPAAFLSDFDLLQYHEYQEYAERVYDLLSKMLQPKASRRFSLLELNAVKFLRAGTIDKPAPLELAQPDGADHVTGLSGVTITSPFGDRRQSAPQLDYFDSKKHRDGPARLDSRYEREFEEVGKLGKGGFGEVVKARNRMEGTFYAIKKIKHRADKLEGLLSEVLSLARLNHQYIVRYYSCWVEELGEDDGGSESDDSEVPNIRSSSFVNTGENSFQVDYFSSLDPLLDYSDDDFDDRVVFEASTSNSQSKSKTETENETETESESDSESDSTESDSAEAKSAKSANFDSGSDSESDSDESDSNESDSTKSKPRPSQGKTVAGKVLALILYIQMEFCENNTLLDLIERGLFRNPDEYWRLFRQMLEAVLYIHSSGFIHRDLKPTNIFIDKSNNVKVGDFGLAKSSHLLSALLNNNQVAPAGTNKDFSTVVGTFLYTAREVATGDYNEKVDMYSLGVIFFEMCYELGTGMERAVTLNNLRLEEIKVPEPFLAARYSTERAVVVQLLNHDSAKRPGASELLQSGLLPVEHQHEIIKEALRSLADPASPWQQQVRESLFNQPYLLARDMMFDRLAQTALEQANSDGELFNLALDEMFRIFHTHGALRHHSGASILPKLPVHSGDPVYDVLDRSGAVLTLPYDLVLPMARFLSTTGCPTRKLCHHEFVYRPNPRRMGVPDRYSAVAFDVVASEGTESSTLDFDTAECIKVADEVVATFPCFRTRFAQTVIVVNHCSILNSCIDLAFGGESHHQNETHYQHRHNLMAVLSQLSVEKTRDDIKTSLRNDFKIQHTVVKDLVDTFDFVADPLAAEAKLLKAFVDSPLRSKVERALAEINRILAPLRRLGLRAPVMISPLSSYNARYYDSAVMFLVLHRIDKSRRFSRVATGGRYDRLIEMYASGGLSSSGSASRITHAVGFQLSTSLLVVLMRNSLRRSTAVSPLAANRSRRKWCQPRCDVLITASLRAVLDDAAYDLLRRLWDCRVSCDLHFPLLHDDPVQRARGDGCNWLVSLRLAVSTKKLRRSHFRPVRVRDLSTEKETDLDYDDVAEFLRDEVELRRKESLSESSDSPQPETKDSDRQSGNSDLHDSVIEVNQRVAIVANAAPRGRKNNKREKWELESDAKTASMGVLKNLADSLIVTVDLVDSTLDMILSTLLHVPLDEWLKKLFFTNKLIPRSYAANIYDTLTKERARGSRWAMLYNPKTENTAIVDLQR